MDVRLLKKARAKFNSRIKDCVVTHVGGKYLERNDYGDFYWCDVRIKYGSKRATLRIHPTNVPAHGKCKLYKGRRILETKKQERELIIDIARRW